MDGQFAPRLKLLGFSLFIQIFSLTSYISVAFTLMSYSNHQAHLLSKPLEGYLTKLEQTFCVLPLPERDVTLSLSPTLLTMAEQRLPCVLTLARESSYSVFPPPPQPSLQWLNVDYFVSYPLPERVATLSLSPTQFLTKQMSSTELLPPNSRHLGRSYA